MIGSIDFPEGDPIPRKMYENENIVFPSKNDGEKVLINNRQNQKASSVAIFSEEENLKSKSELLQMFSNPQKLGITILINEGKYHDLGYKDGSNISANSSVWIFADHITNLEFRERVLSKLQEKKFLPEMY